MCWYCYWGWSSAVAAIYRRYLTRVGFDPLHFGPAHSVWEDENFGRASVQWCLDHFDEHVGDLTIKEQEAVRQSLKDLLALPDALLDPEYGDGDPADSPPFVPVERPPTRYGVI